MDYIKEKAPPVREDRLMACNAFGGSCCKLGEQAKKGCLVNIKRSFAQTQGCQLNLSLAIINTLRDTVIVVHAPLGCGGSSLAVAGISKSFKKMRDASSMGLVWVNTNLDENDVINGGEQKLKDAVLFAEKEFRPEAIIVVNSCVPAIIGDDIDSVLEELQKQVSAKIVPVHCEGFKTKIMASAYDAVYHGILRKLVKKKQREELLYEDELVQLKEKYRISRTVNILNVSSMSRQDEDELVRLVKALGLNVRILPCYAHPGDFEEACEAALNVSICATHDDYFVEHIKEKYGIPFVLKAIPIGIKNTSQWLLDIGRFFGMEDMAQKLVETETRELLSALEPYREILQGKKAFLGGGEIRILSTAELLQSVGIEIVGLKGYHYDRFADHLLDNIINNENIIFNVATGQPFEQANLLERLKPDIYIGHAGTNGYTAKQGFPIFPLFGQTSVYMGYVGAYEIIRKISRVLRNSIFNKNLSENTRMPYFKKWYEQDPFTYIDDSQAL